MTVVTKWSLSRGESVGTPTINEGSNPSLSATDHKRPY